MSENKTKLGQEPAFQVPTNCSLKRDNNENIINSPEDGMSKRLYIACEAMKAMISNPNIRRPDKDYSEKPSDYEKFIAIAYEYADELLRQE